MVTEIESLGTLLGVWAHPDDETYLSAGIMSAASGCGQRVVCVTATKGEAGSSDLDKWPLESLPEVREKELKEALSILSAGDAPIEHHWLGYRDGECDRVDPDEAIAKLAGLIDGVQPDSVLTFGPDGMTGHTDHKAVCNWTTAAFKTAAPAGSKLYYATTTQELFDLVAPVFEPFNVFFAGLPAITDPDDLAIDFPLDDDLIARKEKAIRAQASQSEGMFEALDVSFFVASQRREFYSLAATR
ncbi:MAG: PIG-L deacetylase family protein [Actinomycetota bacterium]